MAFIAIGLCIPLLAVVCALGTRGAALVTGVTRDTARVSAMCYGVLLSSSCGLYPMFAVGEGYCEGTNVSEDPSGYAIRDVSQARDRGGDVCRVEFAVVYSRHTD